MMAAHAVGEYGWAHANSCASVRLLTYASPCYPNRRASPTSRSAFPRPGIHLPSRPPSRRLDVVHLAFRVNSVSWRDFTLYVKQTQFLASPGST